ncbi:MAG: BspA family leucine-rich repeat surface protein, partial [Bacteroidales bacterium]|nr:BspA family leucine-rich repeat surface protein [Bacteroidales bacterium]
GCSSLTTLDVSNFNTANVTDMGGMFSDCRSLTTLDLSNFNTANVTDMYSMFYYCISLNAIFVGDDWSTASVTESSAMFEDCAKLYGGKGTAYNADITDATYAKIDGGKDAPGYFTKSGDPAFDPHKPYAIVKDGVVTFYSGISVPDGALPMRTEMDDKNWTSSIRSSITKVVFDKTFKEYKPVKLSYWFNSMENLTEISGMENLNTENVEYMSAMFQFSKNLTSIDLSGFNTAKVTDMTRLFYGCENLESIFVGDNWSTASVTKSSGMFDDCTKLYGGKGTAYNADITDATYAKIDGGKDAPGYFTKSGEPAFKIVIVSIEIATAPKTEYTEGEDFSAADGILSLVYNTGLKESIDLSKATITGYDKNKVGEQTLKIAYEGFETELKVTVKAKQPTPVSSVADSPNIKVWSFNSTIYIETLPDSQYKIIDLQGRTIKSATTKSSYEEVNINNSGIYVVIINGKSYKVSL